MSTWLIFIISLSSFYILYYFYKKYTYKLNLPNTFSKDKIILLTGGCLGIGKEVINILLTNKLFKCIIINIDIREQLFIEDESFRLFNYKCDLTIKEEINTVLTDILSKFKKIDILINNAGIAFNKNFNDLEENYFTKTLEVNLIAPMILSKRLIKHNKTINNKLHIITISSVMSHLIADNSSDYITSKWGLYAFHECLRYDYYNNNNLNFTLICPFACNTGMFPGFKSPIPFLNVLETTYVANEIINSIIMKEKIRFIPFYTEYICLIYRLLPTWMRDFIYFKISI